MAVGKTFGDQCREARLGAISSNEKLGTYAGAAEVLDVASPETIGRWERDETTPSNHNVRRMAQAYQAPHLMQSYCSTLCPIGRGRMAPASDIPIEQIAIKVFGASDQIPSDIKALLMISADGKIDDGELKMFQEIVGRFGGLKNVINALQLYAEKHGI